MAHSSYGGVNLGPTVFVDPVPTAIAEPLAIAEPRPGDVSRWTVRQVAQGDKVAFVALYEALNAEVHERVGTRLADARQVESVVSATFLEMRRLARFHTEPASDVRAWVYAIADTRTAESLGRSRDAAVPGSAAIERDQWWAGMASAHDCRREQEFRQLFT